MTTLQTESVTVNEDRDFLVNHDGAPNPTVPEVVVKVFVEGFVPQVSTVGLEQLRRALVNDDPRLLQGTTTTPPPLQAFSEEQVTGCCPICWTLWYNHRTVSKLEIAFARACNTAGEILGDLFAARYFLNWVDETPRHQMRSALLAMVDMVLAKRRQSANIERQTR